MKKEKDFEETKPDHVWFCDILEKEIAKLELSELAAVLCGKARLDNGEKYELKDSVFLTSLLDRFAVEAVEAQLGLQVHEVVDEELERLSLHQRARWEEADEEDRQGLWWAVEQLFDYARPAKEATSGTRAV